MKSYDIPGSRSADQGTPSETLQKEAGSENGDYGYRTPTNFSSAEDKRTICPACERRFWPDWKGQKYCDRLCYAAWLGRAPIVDRFWAKVNKNGPTALPELGPCWLWTASTTGRRAMHGQFVLPRVDGEAQRHVYAHRFSWELAYGPIPDGLSVLHRCDVGACVRPSHLFIGTQQDNLADARQKGRLDNSKSRGERRFSSRFVLVPFVHLEVRGEVA